MNSRMNRRSVFRRVTLVLGCCAAACSGGTTAGLGPAAIDAGALEAGVAERASAAKDAARDVRDAGRDGAIDRRPPQERDPILQVPDVPSDPKLCTIFVSKDGNSRNQGGSG